MAFNISLTWKFTRKSLISENTLHTICVSIFQGVATDADIDISGSLFTKIGEVICLDVAAYLKGRYKLPNSEMAYMSSLLPMHYRIVKMLPQNLYILIIIAVSISVAIS